MIHIDDELAVKAKEGDSAALLQVWHKSRAIRVCAARRVWDEDREDWENESFFAVLHALRNYDPALGHFDSYLTVYLKSYRARFRPRDVVRAPARKKDTTVRCELDAATPSFELEYLSCPPSYEGVNGEDVARMLETLDERKREVVVRRFGLDGSHPQTLEEIACSLSGSSKAHRWKGRHQLSRERVRQLCEEALADIRHEFGINRKGG